MKSTLYIFGNTHSFQCESPIVSNIDQLGVDLWGIAERLCEGLVIPFFTKVLDTNLLMCSTFLLAYCCPELIQERTHISNVSRGNTLKKDGSVLLSINRETVSKLFHLEEKYFIDLTPSLSTTRFSEQENVYRKAIPKRCIDYFYKGDSRL